MASIQPRQLGRAWQFARLVAQLPRLRPIAQLPKDYARLPSRGAPASSHLYALQKNETAH